MTYTIGELSRRTGVKVPTIRYYETEGLIAEPMRTEGNQRRYEQADLDQLSFIRHARDLGLPMSAVRALLDLGAHPEAPCADVDQIARGQLASIRERIAQLQRLEAELARIAASCDGHHSISDCNVLKAFTSHEMCAGDH